jgi:competence protein ComEA
MKIFLAALAVFPVLALATTVNVNTAQQSELQRVKGLDKAKAKAIIEWRAANGSIDTFAELERVPGMTHDVVERAKPDLAFDGPAYVPPAKKTAAKKRAAPPTLARN